MPKTARYKTFLIVVVNAHQPRRTYAVVKRNPDEALAAMTALSLGRSKAYLAGGLSRNMVRRMKLKPDEVRLV